MNLTDYKLQKSFGCGGWEGQDECEFGVWITHSGGLVTSHLPQGVRPEVYKGPARSHEGSMVTVSSLTYTITLEVLIHKSVLFSGEG